MHSLFSFSSRVKGKISSSCWSAPSALGFLALLMFAYVFVSDQKFQQAKTFLKII
jgi:hypothetical protein